MTSVLGDNSVPGSGQALGHVNLTCGWLRRDPEPHTAAGQAETVRQKIGPGCRCVSLCRCSFHCCRTSFGCAENLSRQQFYMSSCKVL